MSTFKSIIGYTFIAIFGIAFVLHFLPTRSASGLETELQNVQSQYAELAEVVRQDRIHTSIREEREKKLLLLHAQGERVRAEMSLQSTLVGKEAGKQ